jgi:hypothetical protein
MVRWEGLSLVRGEGQVGGFILVRGEGQEEEHIYNITTGSTNEGKGFIKTCHDTPVMQYRTRMVCHAFMEIP